MECSTRSPSGRFGPLRRILPHLHTWAGLVLACLVTVFVVSPRDPERLLRQLLIGALALYAAVVCTPGLRRLASSILAPGRRVLSIVMLNVVLMTLGSEIALRLLARWFPSPVLAAPNASSAEMIRRWRGRPGARFNDRTLNSGGYLDTEFVRDPIPGVVRIAALADSFGIGVVPYDANFLTQLDELLDPTTPTDVYNFGVPAIGPTDYLYLYRTEVEAYDPDLVLVCFFIGNDVERRPPPSRLHAESLYSVAVVKRLLAVHGLAGDLPLTDEGTPTLSEEQFYEVELGRLQIAIRPEFRGPAVASARASYRQTFEVIDEMSATMEQRLRVVLIPDEYQVNDALFGWLIHRRGVRNVYDPKVPTEIMKQHLESRGIAYLDLLPVLREAQRHASTYKLRDTHWNRFGNAVAAKAISAWLSKDVAAFARTARTDRPRNEPR